MLLPRRHSPYTLRVLPRRAKDRRLIEEETVMKFSTLVFAEKRQNDLMLKLEPMWQ